MSNTKRLKAPPPPLIISGDPKASAQGGDAKNLMVLDIDSVLAAEKGPLNSRVILKFRGRRWLFYGALEAQLSLFDEDLNGAAALLKFIKTMLAEPYALDDEEEVDEKTGEKIPNSDEDVLELEPAEKIPFPLDITLAEASALMQVYSYHVFGMAPGELSASSNS